MAECMFGQRRCLLCVICLRVRKRQLLAPQTRRATIAQGPKIPTLPLPGGHPGPGPHPAAAALRPRRHHCHWCGDTDHLAGSRPSGGGWRCAGQLCPDLEALCGAPGVAAAAPGVKVGRKEARPQRGVSLGGVRGVASALAWQLWCRPQVRTISWQVWRCTHTAAGSQGCGWWCCAPTWAPPR